MIQFLLNIQSFFENLFRSFLTLPKILLWSRKVNLPEAGADELVILGNGPSLQAFLKNHADFLSGKKILAVNHFARTADFTRIKPGFFVINAPEYWQDNVDEDVKQETEKLLKALKERTTWDMNLLLGMGAKKSKKWKDLSAQNPHLKLHFFNPAPIEGFRWFRHFCYRKNCGMPRPHNVLIPSLMLAVNMGFKKIYVAGADHSWLEEIFVADDNTVYLTQRHFYDAQTARPDVMKKMGKNKRKLHEILHKFMLAFRGYFDIDEYARTRNAQIINITPRSFIDAFERKKLD